MLYKCLFLATAGLSIFCHSAHAQHQSHRSDHLNYKTCDGRAYTARWNGNDFLHIEAATNSVHNDHVIRYLTWDSRCWEAYWNPTLEAFVHKDLSTNAQHSDSLLNYLTTDGSKWSAVRAEGGFYHEYVAEPDPAERSAFQRIVDRIKRFCTVNRACKVTYTRTF